MEEQGMLNPDGSLVNDPYLNPGTVVLDDGDGELSNAGGRYGE